MNALNAFELPVLDWIQANLVCPFLDTICPFLSMLCAHGEIWIALALLFLIFPKTRRMGLGMSVALLLGLIFVNGMLKPLIFRIRPFDFNEANIAPRIKDLLFNGTFPPGNLSDGSFPSGHTVASFEACSVMLYLDKRWGIPALSLALFIAFSRLYLYVHYPTDVLAAIVLGFLFGLVGVLVTKLIYRKVAEKKNKANGTK